MRQAEISRNKWGVRVDKVHPLGPLIEAQAGAMRPRHLTRQRHLAPPIRPTSEIL